MNQDHTLQLSSSSFVVTWTNNVEAVCACVCVCAAHVCTCVYDSKTGETPVREDALKRDGCCNYVHDSPGTRERQRIQEGKRERGIITKEKQERDSERERESSVTLPTSTKPFNSAGESAHQQNSRRIYLSVCVFYSCHVYEHAGSV